MYNNILTNFSLKEYFEIITVKCYLNSLYYKNVLNDFNFKLLKHKPVVRKKTLTLFVLYLLKIK